MNNLVKATSDSISQNSTWCRSIIPLRWRGGLLSSRLVRSPNLFAVVEQGVSSSIATITRGILDYGVDNLIRSSDDRRYHNTPGYAERAVATGRAIRHNGQANITRSNPWIIRVSIWQKHIIEHAQNAKKSIIQEVPRHHHESRTTMLAHVSLRWILNCSLPESLDASSIVGGVYSIVSSCKRVGTRLCTVL